MRRDVPIQSVLWTLLVLLVAGCGSGARAGDGANGAVGADAGAGSLIHVDGTLAGSPDGFTLTPEDGGDQIEFRLGPTVEPNGVRAFAASGAEARVTYRLTEEQPIAVAVQAPPEVGEGLERYEGAVERVSGSEITIDGEDGRRTFRIAAADRSAFDRPHLEDHERAGTPIRIYYRDEDAAVAYEDA